jgi:transcriptional regulator of arginine metabolism
MELFCQFLPNLLDSALPLAVLIFNAVHKITVREMSVQKRFRQGQILKLLAAHPVVNQDELRRQLVHLGVRLTQATLSRDLRELRLVKTQEGYRPLSAGTAEEASPLPTLARALKEFLLDVRPAQNMLVLKTPPGGAQPLAAAVDGERWKEIAGTLAGDDTVLIVASSRNARAVVQKRLEEMLR